MNKGKIIYSSFVALFIFLSVHVHASDKNRLDSLLSIYKKDSLHANSFLLNSIGSEYYTRYTYEGYNNALRFHQKALQLSLYGNDPYELAWSYRLIAAVYDATNLNLDTASLYYQKFLDYQLSTKDSLAIVDAFRNVLVISYKRKDPATEFEYAEKLYAYLKDAKGHDYDRYKNQLANYYARRKEIEKAKTLYVQIDPKKAAKEDIENFRNYFHAGHFLYQNQKKYKEAIDMLTEVLKYTELTVDSISIYKYLSEHYFSIGDYKNAFLALEKNSILLDNYSIETNKNKIAETVSFYTNEQKEKERIALKEKAEAESKIMNYTLMVLFLLIAVAITIAIFAIQTKKRNKLLKLQKEEVDRLNILNQKIFSVISHDFSGPLISTSLLLSSLQKPENSKDEINEYAADISNQLIQSKLILENLLSWANAELRGDTKTNGTSACNARAISQEILTQLTPSLEQKKISVQNAIPEDLNLNIKPDILRIILRNLISNAIKFSFESGKIEISGNTAQGTIFVKDNGTGMSSQKAKELFHKAVGNTLGTNNETGFGLGLYIISELIYKSGGSIQVESELNKGTTFYVKL